MKKKIKIINLKVGNINSVENIFKFLDCDTSIQYDFEGLENADGIVIPGNGNFQYVSEQLEKKGVSNFLNIINKKKIPVLGICIGFQILFEKGFENDVSSNGLGVFKGEIKLIKNISNEFNFTLPHVGWNDIVFQKKIPLLYDLKNKSSFYFLHSFICKNKDMDETIATTEYGESFASIVKKDNIIGVLFHPEKSHENGIKLLSNWVNFYVKN